MQYITKKYFNFLTGARHISFNSHLTFSKIGIFRHEEVVIIDANKYSSRTINKHIRFCHPQFICVSVYFNYFFNYKRVQIIFLLTTVSADKGDSYISIF